MEATPIRKRPGRRVDVDPELVRIARHLAGISQATVAQRAGISQVAVSQIEHGKQGVSPELLPRLAAALGTEPDRLLRRHQRRRG